MASFANAFALFSSFYHDVVRDSAVSVADAKIFTLCNQLPWIFGVSVFPFLLELVVVCIQLFLFLFQDHAIVRSQVLAFCNCSQKSGTIFAAFSPIATMVMLST